MKPNKDMLMGQALAAMMKPARKPAEAAVALSTVDELDGYLRALLDESACPVVYVAHPVGGDVTANLKSAFLWMDFLLRRWPGVAFIAPWIVDAHVLDDADAEHREAGLVRDEAVVRLVDVLLLLGGRVSSGMERERVAAVKSGVAVVDFTGAGGSAPSGRGKVCERCQRPQLELEECASCCRRLCATCLNEATCAHSCRGRHWTKAVPR